MSRYIDIDAFIADCEQCTFTDVWQVYFALGHQPSIDVPTKPPADVIGYRWKLKWVLEEAPDIIDALMERSSE